MRLVEEFLGKEEVQRIEKDVKMLNCFMKELDNLHTWKQFSNNDDLKIYYKQEPGQT